MIDTTRTIFTVIDGNEKCPTCTLTLNDPRCPCSDEFRAYKIQERKWLEVKVRREISKRFRRANFSYKFGMDLLSVVHTYCIVQGKYINTKSSWYILIQESPNLDLLIGYKTVKERIDIIENSIGLKGGWELFNQ
jgi:hypothetical protein